MRLSAALLVLFLGCGPWSGPPPQAWPSRPVQDDPGVRSFADRYGAGLAPAEQTGGGPLEPAALRRLALAEHPDVLLALAEVERAEARRISARSWPDPELEGRVLFGRDGEVHTEGALLFPIPVSGRVAAQRRVAALELEIAERGLEAARKRAVVDVQRLVARLDTAHSKLVLLDGLADRSEALAALVRQRRESGVADPLDVSLVLADAARDRRAALAARVAVDHADAELRRLVGVREAELEVGGREVDHLVEQRAELVRAAGEHRDGLALARLEVERAAWDVRRVARERVPDPAIGPAVAAEGGAARPGLAVGVPVPLYAPGRGARREALAVHRAAQQTLAVEERSAMLEVAHLHERVVTLQDELDALSGEPAAAVEQAAELARERYDAGRLDVLHLLAAHRADADLRLERLDLILALEEALLDLERAVGRPIQTEPWSQRGGR